MLTDFSAYWLLCLFPCIVVLQGTVDLIIIVIVMCHGGGSHHDVQIAACEFKTSFLQYVESVGFIAFASFDHR